MMRYFLGCVVLMLLLGSSGEKPPEPTPENVQQELKQLDEARQREMSNQ